MMRRACATVVAAALLVTAGGCGAAEEEPPAEHLVHTSVPAGDVTVLTEERPGALARAVSGALFDRAEVVVLAGEDDPAGHRQAVALADDLAIPLLLTPPAGERGAGLPEELRRLSTDTVLAADEAAERWAGALDDPPVEVVPAGDGPPPDLAPVAGADPVPGVTVLAAERAGPEAAETTEAAVATARAAGARVLTTGVTDPRASPELVAALAESPPEHTVALGAQFGPADLLRQRVAVAATGTQLPGGGQVLFPGRRLVALYGHPGNGRLGALGEQPLEETITRAREVAQEYEDVVDEPVVPTLEIITTIASSGAGPEGDYSRRTPVEDLQPWVDAAADAGLYVVLDLQPGHTDFLTQAQEYERLLREPHVGLALDPEWRLAPDQRHMVDIGSVGGAEVDEVVGWLAELVVEHRLPQKLLIVHQFTRGMFTGRDQVDLDRDEVAVMIHADGFGTPAQKQHTWEVLHQEAPAVWWGWKNFYDEDDPMLTPAETVQVDPVPWFVSYQ